MRQVHPATTSPRRPLPHFAARSIRIAFETCRCASSPAYGESLRHRANPSGESSPMPGRASRHLRRPQTPKPDSVRSSAGMLPTCPKVGFLHGIISIGSWDATAKAPRGKQEVYPQTKQHRPNRLSSCREYLREELHGQLQRSCLILAEATRSAMACAKPVAKPHRLRDSCRI